MTLGMVMTLIRPVFDTTTFAIFSFGLWYFLTLKD